MLKLSAYNKETSDYTLEGCLPSGVEVRVPEQHKDDMQQLLDELNSTDNWVEGDKWMFAAAAVQMEVWELGDLEEAYFYDWDSKEEYVMESIAHDCPDYLMPYMNWERLTDDMTRHYVTVPLPNGRLALFDPDMV